MNPLIERLIILAIASVLKALLADLEARQAIKYINPTLRVKATRYRRQRKGDRTDVRLTIGRPNSREQEFIKACKAAGEAFPVKKVQLRHYRAKATSTAKRKKK